MRRLVPLLPLLACDPSGRLLDLRVWDAADACFRLEVDALDVRDLPPGDCATVETPAVRADGACVILPSACLPRGFAPAAAATGCDVAFAAWEAGIPDCDALGTP